MACGGRAYGYIAARDAASGEREVHPEQAETVRRILQWNAKRHRGWVATAINGDRKRGTGILNNRAYIGQLLWVKSRA
jgi:site-specific DNA recombinase